MPSETGHVRRGDVGRLLPRRSHRSPQDPDRRHSGLGATLPGPLASKERRTSRTTTRSDARAAPRGAPGPTGGVTFECGPDGRERPDHQMT
jgi:hypothetical protein